jgi:hypothetical protein
MGGELVRLLFQAAVLTAAGYAIAWRWQGADLFQHPGHWLLVLMAVSNLAMIANGVVSRFYLATQSSAGPLRAIVLVMLYVPLSVLQFAPGIFSLYVGLRKCRKWHWKTVFFTYVFAGVLLWVASWAALRLIQTDEIAFRILYYGGWVTSIGIAMTALAYAVWSDQRQGLLRDTLHRCGVGLYVATSTWMMVVAIAWWMFV